MSTIKSLIMDWHFYSNDPTTRFQDILSDIEQDPACHQLPLQSFLALPMQRVTRYPLLLDSICQRLPMNSAQRQMANRTCDTLRAVIIVNIEMIYADII